MLYHKVAKNTCLSLADFKLCVLNTISSWVITFVVYFHLQISALTKKNKILAEKCKQNEYAGSTVGEKENEIQAGLGSAEAPEEASTESSSTDVQVGAVARPLIYSYNEI